MLASRCTLDASIKAEPKFSGYAVQKFNRLIVEGLANNGACVKVLSSFFMSKRLFWHHKKETVNSITYKYIPSINIALVRHALLMCYCFLHTLAWGIVDRKNKALVCDVLNVSACLGAVAAAKLIHLRSVGIVTDMPGMMVGTSKRLFHGERDSLNTRINKVFLGKFTHYVFLTKQMNEVLNINHRPYIVMEGLVDSNEKMPNISNKETKRIVLYAGGLHERYGLKMLVEGFMQLDFEDVELWLYGGGPFAENLPDYIKQDSRVVYKGIRPNSEVLDSEFKATLLVNPRPSHEKFTQYSFPSKNMEYMLSGTPVLTTILPGMPQEYYPYVYLFDEGESTEGYSKVLNRVLSLPTDELKLKGVEARDWVLKHKNNKNQANRIIQLIGCSQQ